MTRLTVARARRPEIDLEAKRYFVYYLLDAQGRAVYVGRSCNVAARIRAHYSDATHPHSRELREAKSWVFDVRKVSLVGPFTWREAIDRERAEIERLQPRGNRDLTARDHRPAVAARSAVRADVERLARERAS